MIKKITETKKTSRTTDLDTKIDVDTKIADIENKVPDIID